MRPLKLTMAAFGPYAKVQALDFGELKDRCIFLINGPTGSGKTTILDAICFALYGDSSGAERNGKSMRSQFADSGQMTEVIFEFEVRGDKYRVYRKPEQERPKKSGEGTTTQLAEATIWKLSSEGESVVGTGWRNVTEAVEKIIGFRSEQFRQVIMLPQGQFRELLTAGSKDRQDILERLFHTEIYRQIEEFLKKKAKELDTSIREKEKEKTWNLKKTGCESLLELEDLIRKSAEELLGAGEEFKEKSSIVEKAREILVKGREGNGKLNEKEGAFKEHEKLKSLIGEFDKKRVELECARTALTLEETERATLLRSKDKDTCEKDLSMKENLLSVAQKDYDKARILLDEEAKKDGEREESKKRVIELESFTDKVKSLDSSRETLDTMKKTLEKCERDEDRLKKETEELRNKIVCQEALVSEAKEDSNKVALFKAMFEEAERIHKKRESFEKKRGELVKITKQYESDSNKFRFSERDYIRAKDDFFNLQEAWNKGQASILSKDLNEGTPCPVCGSIHHPTPAVMEDWMPTEQELKAKKELMDKLEKAKDDMSKTLNAITTGKKTLENDIEAIGEELAGHKDIELGALRENVIQAKKLLDKAVQESKGLEEYSKALEFMKEKEVKEKEKLEKIELALKGQREGYQNAKGAYEEKERSIPEEIRNMAALLKEQQRAQNIFNKLNQDFEDAKRKLENAANSLTAAKTSRDNSDNALKDAVAKYLDEKRLFKESMNNAGFENYAAYSSAKRDKNPLERLEHDIKDFDGKLQSAKDNYVRMCKAAEAIARVDIKMLEEELKTLEAARDNALKQVNTLSQKIKDSKKIMDDILKLDEGIKEKRDEYGILGTLSDVANGSRPNAYGITFERFILGWLLDEITIAATERLKMMSRGRYHLRRTLDRERKNSAAGLDLEVFDTYTGYERPVTTLSGGESFLASLSLALGLADVVQSYSGGISLDTIFVDEGFGTLDPETLDFAIKTLIDLQKGGRLVGIISHVPELKDRIDARLDVIPTDRGSMACFKVS